MLILAGLLLAARLKSAKVSPIAGREVMLFPGQIAEFADLRMGVEFVSVIADTRNSGPDGTGEASCLVRVLRPAVHARPYRMVLTQHSRADQSATRCVAGYEFRFTIKRLESAGHAPNQAYCLVVSVLALSSDEAQQASANPAA